MPEDIFVLPRKVRRTQKTKNVYSGDSGLPVFTAFPEEMWTIPPGPGRGHVRKSWAALLSNLNETQFHSL